MDSTVGPVCDSVVDGVPETVGADGEPGALGEPGADGADGAPGEPGAVESQDVVMVSVDVSVAVVGAPGVVESQDVVVVSVVSVVVVEIAGVDEVVGQSKCGTT